MALYGDEYVPPCTHGAGEVCAFFRDLHAVNRVLLQVELELRETAPAQLTLLPASIPRPARVLMTPAVWRLLDVVLQRHRCIVSVDINGDGIDVEPMRPLIDMLVRKAPSLVMLRLRTVLNKDEEVQALAASLLAAHRLQDLSLEGIGCMGAISVGLLASFIQNTTTLTKLSMAATHIEPRYAPDLLGALSLNTTIRTLTLSTCSCYRGYVCQYGPLLHCLVDGCSALRTLTLDRCCLECTPGLRLLMKALVVNTRVSTLSLCGFAGSEAFVEFIPQLLAQNRTLRSLTVLPSATEDENKCRCVEIQRCEHRCMECADSDFGGVASIAAGLPYNFWLQELTVDLSWCSREQCRRFFEAFRTNCTLHKVVVQGIHKEDFRHVCRRIRESGIAGRVSLHCFLPLEEHVEDLTACRKVLQIYLDATRPGRDELLRRTLTVLPFRKHVSMLVLQMTAQQVASEFARLVSYLEREARLKHLNLFVGGPVLDVDVRRRLLVALLRNRSLQVLELKGDLVTCATEALIVANELCTNNTLCEFSLLHGADATAEDTFMDALLRHLIPGLMHNHTLCSLLLTMQTYSVPYHAVLGVVCRNRATTMCAANFVLGTDRSERSADALSRVQHSPALLRQVMQIASLDEIEAQFAIQRALCDHQNDAAPS
ncbi:hypothetical protein V5799_022346 [Amblyomma americanum]|uniref:Uncharacterized protein n=1 Tax=Amblyomma americanum TaxID=6943 RepID=A0AAQ4FMT6_AMBAM